MSEELQENDQNELTARVPLEPVRAKLLPGMVVIALYMLLLAAVVSFDVVGGHVPRIFLVLAPLFVTASFGMLRMFRWAWALTLAAVFLLMSYDLWLFFALKEAGGAVQGALNLVLFLYLVRVEVRDRLR